MEELDLALDVTGEIPVYVQIKNRLKLAIHQKTLQVGDRLPTMPALASCLGVNPNTVNRAYSELEREGYLSRRQGAGTFVHQNASGLQSAKPGLDLVKETTRQLRGLGLTAQQIIELTVEAVSELE